VGYTAWNGSGGSAAGSLTFSAGATQVTFQVTAYDDNRWSPVTQSVTVSLSSSAANSGTMTAVATIAEDNDPPPMAGDSYRADLLVLK